MALSATVLSAAIKAKRLADPDCQAIDGAALTADCKAIAEAVIEQFGAAVVLPLLLVAPPGGGPVTGTGTIT